MIAPDGESNIIPHHHFMTFVTLTIHINEGVEKTRYLCFHCKWQANSRRKIRSLEYFDNMRVGSWRRTAETYEMDPFGLHIWWNLNILRDTEKGRTI
jgi:hypothetical protein